ncbi:MAG TPA: hypothetical protein H9956_00610 [Candidatus Eisenbergiella pullicola]|nr:hypothetical protein [Candidatus Eisenbergiella pullicola]
MRLAKRVYEKKEGRKSDDRAGKKAERHAQGDVDRNHRLGGALRTDYGLVCEG